MQLRNVPPNSLLPLHRKMHCHTFTAEFVLKWRLQFPKNPSGHEIQLCNDLTEQVGILVGVMLQSNLSLCPQQKAQMLRLKQ